MTLLTASTVVELAPLKYQPFEVSLFLAHSNRPRHTNQPV